MNRSHWLRRLMILGLICGLVASLFPAPQHAAATTPPLTHRFYGPETFNTPPLHPNVTWSSTQTTDIPGIERFLGPFVVNAPVMLTMTNLPPHESITITFDLYTIGGWEGNTMPWHATGFWEVHKVLPEGAAQNILTTTFNNWYAGDQAYPGQWGASYPPQQNHTRRGRLLYPPLRSSPYNTLAGYGDVEYHLSYNLADADSALTLSFNAYGADGMYARSWGIDNVEVDVGCADCAGMPPVITVQPLSRSVYPLNATTFAVQATGTLPLTYQWYTYTNRISTPIDGAVHSTYTIPEIDPGDQGAYYVVVSNPFGRVVSNKATLRVDPPPAP